LQLEKGWLVSGKDFKQVGIPPEKGLIIPACQL